MVELVGDICRPSDFILPNNDVSAILPSIRGQMVMSGADLLWFDGSSVQTLSGSNTGD